MLQELFRIPYLDWPVHGFGLMLVIGLLAVMHVAKILARRCGLDPELFINAALLALVTGIAGARLSHVLENLSQYTRDDRSIVENLFAAVNIGDGGLTYYGGFLLAFPTLVGYALWKKIPLRTGMDIVAPCLMIGLGFGRIGCFLNGCCFGAACDLPWAVQFPYNSPPYVHAFYTGQIDPSPELIGLDEEGQLALIPQRELRQFAPSTGERHLLDLATNERSNPVHPAQLYSAITALLLAGVLLAYFTLPHAPGHVFALMMILEGIARFILELLRVERRVLGPLSYSMAMSIGIVVVGLVLWLVFRHLHRPPQHKMEPLPAAA